MQGDQASGIKRFFELAENNSVEAAQEQAELTDEELDELVTLCAKVLDSEQFVAAYDLSVWRRVDCLEKRLRGENRTIISNQLRLIEVVERLVDAVHGKREASAEPALTRPSTAPPRNGARHLRPVGTGEE